MPSFDATNGTDTEGAVALDKLTIASPNASLGYPYQPTPEGVLNDAIAFLGIATSEYGFVDLGCGKGRTLIAATKLGFATVEGVEFAAELVEIARQNLSTVGLADVRVIGGDAAQYGFPQKKLVVYVFNAFAGPVLESVLRNLLAADLENFYLVYRNPSDPDLLHDCDALTYLGSPPTRGGPDGVHVWTRASSEALLRRAARPPRVSFSLFADQRLEPFQAVWGNTGPTRCHSLAVRISYRRQAPIVAHAIVCAFELASPPDPELLRRARLAQSKHFAAFDYLPEPKEPREVCVSELKVRFEREVTVARIGLARWSNAGPITILDCKIKLHASPLSEPLRK